MLNCNQNGYDVPSQNKTYSVYQHLNQVNGKSYIGMTKRNPIERWGTNGSNYISSPHFYAAIKKYGWDSFEHIIIAENLSKEEACALEIELIDKLRANEPSFGYNCTSGGEMPEMNELSRKKLSMSMMGNTNGLGKQCSPEKRRKIGDAQRGRKFSAEHRQRISKAKTGKTHKPISAEARRKIAEKHEMKPVYCPETDTTYESIQECARQLKINATSVCAVCHGKHHTHHGYHFHYAEEVGCINA